MIDFKTFPPLKGLAQLTDLVRLLHGGPSQWRDGDLLTRFRQVDPGIADQESLAQIAAGLTTLRERGMTPDTFDTLRGTRRVLFEAREEVIARLGISRPVQEPNETLIEEVFAELGGHFHLSEVRQEDGEGSFWGNRAFKVAIQDLNGEPAAVVMLVFSGSTPDLISEGSFSVDPKFQGQGLGMALFQRHFLLALELASVSTIHVQADGDGIAAWSGLAGLTATGPLHFKVDLRDALQVGELLRSTEARRKKRDTSAPSAVAQKWFERYAV